MKAKFCLSRRDVQARRKRGEFGNFDVLSYHPAQSAVARGHIASRSRRTWWIPALSRRRYAFTQKILELGKK